MHKNRVQFLKEFTPPTWRPFLCLLLQHGPVTSCEHTLWKTLFKLIAKVHANGLHNYDVETKLRGPNTDVKYREDDWLNKENCKSCTHAFEHRNKKQRESLFPRLRPVLTKQD